MGVGVPDAAFTGVLVSTRTIEASDTTTLGSSRYIAIFEGAEGAWGEGGGVVARGKEARLRQGLVA